MQSRIPTRRDAIGWVTASVCAPVIGLGTVPFAAAAVSVPSGFRKTLEHARMALDTSTLQDFDPARVLPNPDFEYDLAVKHAGSKFEIRYAVQDLGPIQKEMDKKSQEAEADGDPQTVAVPFGDSYTTFAETAVMNMSLKTPQGPVMSPPNEFNPDSVRNEFGADWGFNCWFQPSPTFANYTDGIAVAIYRDDVRTLAFMVYLYQAKEQGGMADDDHALLERTFYALRFE